MKTYTTASMLVLLLLAAPAVAQTTVMDIQDSGGTTLGQINDDAGVLFLGTFNQGTIPATGAGTRMMWYPSKAAFRAGSTFTQWDDANVGDYSVAMGRNTTASGDHSTATGFGSTASGGWSTAMGSGTTANGGTSTAMGSNTTASGAQSTAMGFQTTASNDYAIAMGQNTTASGFASTAMGTGTTASGFASTAMGFFTTAQAYSLVIGRYNVVAGDPFF